MTATSATETLPGVPAARTRGRRFGFFAAVILLGAVALALIAGSTRSETAGLDPENTGPDGTMALVEVLRAQGVDVSIARTAEDAADALGPDTTLVVGFPQYLGRRAAERVRSAAQEHDSPSVILVPEPSLLAAWKLPATTYGGAPPDPVAAGCTDPAVHQGDKVTVEARVVVDDGVSGATSCFPVADPETGKPVGGSAMVRLPATADHPETVITAFPGAFTNRYVTEEAHAGVALRLLGGQTRLVWYHPGIDDLLQDDALEEKDPWPAWQLPALALLGVSFVIFALWAGRRLGRLVSEPLPVVVRAVESTEARALLYRRSKDRARACAILRQGTATRLRRRLGLGPGEGDAALVALVARASGTPPTDVAALLHGPAPTDDTELMRLAQQLHDLEERVKHE